MPPTVYCRPVFLFISLFESPVAEMGVCSRKAMNIAICLLWYIIIKLTETRPPSKAILNI